VLAGLVPQAGIGRGPLRADHERTAKLFAYEERIPAIEVPTLLAGGGSCCWIRR
jgi:hypothetical protein